MDKQRKDERLNVMLDKAGHVKLNNLSECLGMPKSEIVRRMIDRAAGDPALLLKVKTNDGLSY
ncbi:MAG: hypothetical protein ABFD79_12525 [Phycisphaerales bacterium]